MVRLVPPLICNTRPLPLVPVTVPPTEYVGVLLLLPQPVSKRVIAVSAANTNAVLKQYQRVDLFILGNILCNAEYGFQVARIVPNIVKAGYILAVANISF